MEQDETNQLGFQVNSRSVPFHVILIVHNIPYTYSFNSRNNLISSLKILNVPKEELKTVGNLVWWEKDTDKMQSNNFNE